MEENKFSKQLKEYIVEVNSEAQWCEIRNRYWKHSSQLNFPFYDCVIAIQNGEWKDYNPKSSGLKKYPRYIHFPELTFSAWKEMIEEQEFPKKWAIRAKNQEEAEVIAAYADKLAGNKSDWNTEDALTYYLAVSNGVYVEGYFDLNGQRNPSSKDYTEISFDQFKRFVLKEGAFKLPEKWAVGRTTENFSVINKWANDNKLPGEETYYAKCSFVHSEDLKSHPRFKRVCNHVKEGYTEITFEQFKKYVLQSTNNTVSNMNKEQFTVGGSKHLVTAFTKTLKELNYVPAGSGTDSSIFDDDCFVGIKTDGGDRGKAYWAMRDKLSKHYNLPGDWDVALAAFKAYYEEEFKVGDWVVIHTDHQNGHPIGTVARIESLYDGYAKGAHIRHGGTQYSHDLQYLRRATEAEIQKAQKRQIDVRYDGGVIPVEIDSEGTIHAKGSVVSYNEIENAIGVGNLHIGSWKVAFNLEKIDVGCHTGLLVADLKKVLAVSDELRPLPF